MEQRLRGNTVRYEYVVRKLVEYLARKASGMTQRYELKDLVGSTASYLLERSFERIAASLYKTNGGSLWCRLCERGPFTKKGFYLHLIRVHYHELEYIVEDELRKALEVVRR